MAYALIYFYPNSKEYDRFEIFFGLKAIESPQALGAYVRCINTPNAHIDQSLTELLDIGDGTQLVTWNDPELEEHFGVIAPVGDTAAVRLVDFNISAGNDYNKNEAADQINAVGIDKILSDPSIAVDEPMIFAVSVQRDGSATNHLMMGNDLICSYMLADSFYVRYGSVDMWKSSDPSVWFICRDAPNLADIVTNYDKYRAYYTTKEYTAQDLADMGMTREELAAVMGI